MRSWLFVPGDDPKKLEKALASDADAVIVDLEDSVAPERKGAARRTALSFLREASQAARKTRLFVRINALDDPLSEGDLDHVMAAAPDGIALPKSNSGADVERLDARLSVREALHGIEDQATQVMAIATESPAALFGLGGYHGASRRLVGLAWGGEDLAAAIGALSNKDADGRWTEPFRLARNLCLFGAAAAGVDAIDTVFTAFRDEAGLARECEAAMRDGFAGKLAIHPAQVPVINAAFTPSAEAIAQAERVVAAFADAADGGTGVAGLDGRMIDRPHLRAAERLLERARRGR